MVHNDRRWVEGRSSAAMLDHVGSTVKDVAASRKFYVAALAPLGVRVAMEFAGHVGIGRDRKPQFSFSRGDPPASLLHLAFSARNRAEVDAFDAAALGAGGGDNGAGLAPALSCE